MDCTMLLLLLLLSLFNLDNVISQQPPHLLVFNKSSDILPAYYQDFTSIKDNQLIFTPIIRGKIVRLFRPPDEPLSFELQLQTKQDVCETIITFHFPQLTDKSKFQLLKLNIKKDAIALTGKPMILLKDHTKIMITISKTQMKVGVSKTNGETITKSYDNCDLDIEHSSGHEDDDNVYAEFILYATNNACKHQLVFPTTFQLALPFIDTTPPIQTTIPTTTTKKTSTVPSTKKTSTPKKKEDDETENAELAVHWYIVLLIAEIIVCLFIGAFSTWLYVTLTKRFKAQQPSSITSMEEADSHDEEIETALEDLQTAQSSVMDENGTRSQTLSTAPIFGPNSRASLATARQPSYVNNQRNKGKAVSNKQIKSSDGNATLQRPQKSKKSFLERMGNKFKRKSKESNSKKLRQPPQITVSGFSSSATLNPPFGESKSTPAAKKGQSEKKSKSKKSLEEKRKAASFKKIKAYAPFSKEFGGGIDQQGCEPTQASLEEAYQADVDVLSQARKNNEIRARLFAPGGRVRTAKELAEYDAAQKAAAAAGAGATGSTSKKR